MWQTHLVSCLLAAALLKCIRGSVFFDCKLMCLCWFHKYFNICAHLKLLSLSHAQCQQPTAPASKSGRK